MEIVDCGALAIKSPMIIIFFTFVLLTFTMPACMYAPLHRQKLVSRFNQATSVPLPMIDLDERTVTNYSPSTITGSQHNK